MDTSICHRARFLTSCLNWRGTSLHSPFLPRASAVQTEAGHRFLRAIGCAWWLFMAFEQDGRICYRAICGAYVP